MPDRPSAARRRRARYRSRGQCAVLYGLVGFAALQVGFFPLSSWAPQLADMEYGHKLANLRAQLRARASGQPCAVMLGSSLTGWGLNPGSMTRLRPGTPAGPVVYNFGINSSGPVVQLVCLKRLLADGIRPDLVLIEAHPWFLVPYYNHVATEHYLASTRIQFQDLPVLRSYDPDCSKHLSGWRSEQWLPWYHHRHDLQNNFLPAWVSRDKLTPVWQFTDRHGWEGKLSDVGARGPLPPDQQVKSAECSIRTLMASVIDETYIRAYREIVTTCQRANIRVVLVRMPESTYMRDEMPKALQERIDACFLGISRGAGVPVVDARTWVPDTQFLDAFHATIDGSVTFSQRLEREYLVPFFAAAGKHSHE